MPYRKALVYVGLALGLGWAIRGHFGHEWGASWAGAIGAAAVLVAARRPDWLRRLPVLVALGAVGWAVGGMMSYGRVVGFGRGADFINVAYGLTMLGVIGGLYGFIGGGLLGLGLETSPERRPDWARLLTEMVAGAWIAWGLLIYQLEWFMTPPRSELWAACLGAAVALAWFMRRGGYRGAFRTAAYAALGAGFGFAFGNFIQTMGRLTGLALNWWNVMEFSLGFFGGAGMAYGVWTHRWPEGPPPSRTANRLALAFLLLGIPLTNMAQRFETDRFIELAGRVEAADPAAFAVAHQAIGWAALVVFGGLAWWCWRRVRTAPEGSAQASSGALGVLAVYTAYYIVAAHIVKGVLGGALAGQPEQIVYWAVLGLLVGLGVRPGAAFDPMPAPSETPRRWALIIGGFLIVVALLTLVSIGSHDGLDGMQTRF